MTATCVKPKMDETVVLKRMERGAVLHRMADGRSADGWKWWIDPGDYEVETEIAAIVIATGRVAACSDSLFGDIAQSYVICRDKKEVAL
jgi:hypothetical protein